MKRLTALIVVLIAGGGTLAACGGGQSTTATGTGRVVDIEMRDIAFSPTSVTVTKGETVTFRFTNKGKVVHEALIGDQAAQDEHAKSMSNSMSSGASSSMSMSSSSMDSGMGGMNMGGASSSSPSPMGSTGDASKMLTLDPGKKGDLTYTFDQPGSYIIGCHQPGHYEAGMRVAVTVS